MSDFQYAQVPYLIIFEWIKVVWFNVPQEFDKIPKGLIFFFFVVDMDNEDVGMT